MIDLQVLRARYIEWDPDMTKIKLDKTESTGSKNIYPTDLGGCLRKMCLRLTDADKRALYPAEALQFWQGNMIHDLTFRALIHAGLMISYEQRIGAPEGLSGRYDCIWMDEDVVTLTDCKTVRPNSFKWGELAEDPPRVKEAQYPQMGAYINFAPRCDTYDVEYLDRGGAHGALRLPVPIERARATFWETYEQAKAAVNALPDIPPLMEEDVKEHWSRHKPPQLKSIGVKRYWNCDPLYCRYSGVSCFPKGGEDELLCASCEDGKWTFTHEGNKRRELIETTIERGTGCRV